MVSQVAKHPRPINHVKIYGDGNFEWGSGLPKDGVERFWRNIIGGCAAARFHRDGAGTGLQEISKTQIKGVRLLTAELDIFNCTPDAKSELLFDREGNEAYLTCNPNQQYAVYFTDGGSVSLDLSGATGSFTIKWLDIANTKWLTPAIVQGGSIVPLNAPGSGNWVALLIKV